MCLWRSEEMEARIAAAAEENDVYDRLAKSIAPEVRRTSSQLSQPYKSYSVWPNMGIIVHPHTHISAISPPPHPLVSFCLCSSYLRPNRFMGTWT